MNYDLAGLVPDTSAPLRIHTGTTCEDASLVSGHYYANAVDPWTSQTSVTDGAGAITGTIAGVQSALLVAHSVGHAVVVHDGSDPSTRIGCGLCVPSCTATIAPYMYPGYTGSFNVGGTATATATSMYDPTSTIELGYQLTGAEPSYKGAIHFHTGSTCDALYNSVGGHYYSTGVDPWTNENFPTAVDGNGAATGTINVAAGLGFNAIEGHAIVVHSSSGDRIGCGICRAVSVAPEPLCTSSGSEATTTDTCGALKSIFRANTCCGADTKQLSIQMLA